MVCQTSALQPGGLYENDRNRENDKNDEDNSESQTAANKRLSAGQAEFKEPQK